MKRIKMPLYMRMQNFLYLPDGEIFWTSASLTIPQKIKRWWNKDKSEICNTSRGYTLPFHGQNIRTDGFYIYHDLVNDIDVYDLTDGRFIELLKGKSTLPCKEVKAITDTVKKVQQGVCYNPKLGKYDYVVFGTRGKESIDIVNIYEEYYFKQLNYKSLKKWYWSSWEAEGIQLINGKLEIGISVKTIFGAILNYRHEV